MKSFLTVVIFLSGLSPLMAQQDTLIYSPARPPKSLVLDNMLHPGDAFTAYTYRKGEWGFNWALTPYPNWMWVGITDWLTAEIDLEAWIGGVPSFNFRAKLVDQDGARPAFAFEAMYQYLNKEHNLLEDFVAMDVIRQGHSLYNRVNVSYRFGEKFHVHASGGLTFSENLLITSTDSIQPKGALYVNLLSPDFSIGADWRVNDKLAFIGTGSYGSTFTYLDNVPLKQQFTLLARYAPFVRNKAGFLRCFRMEFGAISFYFEDAEVRGTGPIAYLYWQWDWKKKKNKSESE